MRPQQRTPVQRGQRRGADRHPVDLGQIARPGRKPVGNQGTIIGQRLRRRADHRTRREGLVDEREDGGRVVGVGDTDRQFAAIGQPRGGKF